MADYTKRAAEVFSQVLEFVRWSQADAAGAFASLSRTLTPVELDRATEDAGKERDQFLKRTTEYFEGRKSRLDAIVAVVEKIVDDGYNLTGDPESRFRDAIQPLLDDARRILGDLLTGVSSPSQRAVAMQLKFSQEEEAFGTQLMSCRVATCFSQIGRMLRALDDMNQQLDQAWQALATKAGEFNYYSQDLVTEMCNDLREAARKREERDRVPTPALREAADRLRALSSDLKGSGSALDFARTRVKDIFYNLDKMVDNYGDHAIDLGDMLGHSQITVSVMNLGREKTIAWLYQPFKEQRLNVQYFRREPTTDLTRAKSNECRERLGQWVSNLPGQAGLRADAESMGLDLVAALRNRLRDVEVKYQTFEERNRGRFYDTLKSEVEEVLLDTTRWKGYFDRVRAVLPPTLNYSGFPDTVSYAIDGPFSEVTLALKNLPMPGKESERDGAVREIEQIKDTFMREVRDTTSRMQAQAENSNRYYWSAAFTELFQRQEMRRALTG